MAEVILFDYGRAGNVAVRLLRPLPDQVSQTDWLSIDLKIVVLVPDTFQWTKEVRQRMSAFRQSADRITVKVRRGND